MLPSLFSKVTIALVALNLASSCQTTRMNPAEGPTAAESTTAFSRPRSTITPTITVGVSTSQINEGDSATFTFTTSKTNPNSGISVNYAMSGTAVLGTHYTLSGSANAVVIPPGASSASVTLNALLTNLSSGSEVATMNLQPGTGYRLPPVPQASVTILNTSGTPSPTPTPTPSATATPTPGPTQEVWIAVRTDGLPGSGAQTDPYDGSTQQRFDAVMSNLQATPNLKINLGAGTFRTSVTKPWFVNSGWIIVGAGMYDTTIQLTGNVSGMHYGISCLWSNPNLASDNIVIRDLTCDANWAELSVTADDGAGARSVTDAALSKNSPIIGSFSASFSVADFGKRLSGRVIPAGTTIISIQDPQHATMSANATTSANSVSMTIGGEKNIKTSAVSLWGSNNLIQRVRSVNTYGSWANAQEQFDIGLGGPPSGDGTNNVIDSCRAELPQGNYGNPFSLGGWFPYLIRNSKVISCTAVGVNDGGNNGFTTGGVNLAYVKDCQIDGNTFIDCQSAAYQDTGSCDGIHVTNNTVIRGSMAATFLSKSMPKQNIEISGNNLLIQNRYANGGTYGIFVNEAVSTNVTINNNIINFDSSGAGMVQFFGIRASSLNGATISNNIVAPSLNEALGTGVSLFNNRHPDGTPVPGL